MSNATETLIYEPPAQSDSRRVYVVRSPSLIRRKWLALILATVVLAITGYLDVQTGPEFSMALLYLIPVFIVTWYVGPIPGYFTAAASALLRHYAELKGAATYTHLFNAYWNGSVRCAFFLIVAWLISALKRSESRLEMLVEQRTAMLRRLGVQLAETEEAERRSLAHDMHDGLSQSLLLLKMNLDELKTAVATSTPDQLPRLVESLAITDRVLQQTRTLMFDLHPSMLDDLGFVPTLSRFSEEYKRQTGVDVAISESGTPRPLGRSLSHHLFRAAKELLSNAARHGKAREVLISVRWEPARMRLVIDDDGGGFDVETRMSSTARTSLGLVGIQERLVSLNGEFLIESAIGQGTRAVVEVPYDGSGDQNSV